VADTLLSVICESQSLAAASKDRRLGLVADLGVGFRLDPDRRGRRLFGASRPGDDPQPAL